MRKNGTPLSTSLSLSRITMMGMGRSADVVWVVAVCTGKTRGTLKGDAAAIFGSRVTATTLGLAPVGKRRRPLARLHHAFPSQPCTSDPLS